MLQLFTTEVEARSTMLLGVVQIVPPDIYLGRRCPLKTFCDIQKTTNTIDSVYEYRTDESEVPKTAKIIKRSQVGSMDFIAVSSARATDTSLVGLGFACKSISLLAFVPGNNLISDSGILFGFGSR